MDSFVSYNRTVIDIKNEKEIKKSLSNYIIPATMEHITKTGNLWPAQYPNWSQMKYNLDGGMIEITNL